jgi:hypothetical protein
LLPLVGSEGAYLFDADVSRVQLVALHEDEDVVGDGVVDAEAGKRVILRWRARLAQSGVPAFVRRQSVAGDGGLEGRRARASLRAELAPGRARFVKSFAVGYILDGRFAGQLEEVSSDCTGRTSYDLYGLNP